MTAAPADETERAGKLYGPRGIAHRGQPMGLVVVVLVIGLVASDLLGLLQRARS